MKVKELRIGNLFHRINRSNIVHLPETSINLLILTIKTFEVEVLEYGLIPAQTKDWVKIQIRDLSPIPITEEWLFNFGFAYGTSEYYKKLHIEFGDILFEYNRGGIISICENDSSASPICLEYIKYVHQLQNLYFALTGEELTIK